MPTIATLVETARGALVEGDALRADVTCRHILDQYPKHIEANCLLAEALRDQGQRQASKELYLRVASADPTNLLAHWALSIIAEEEKDLEWATWEILRAWETNPGHIELRGDVQRLTGAKPPTTRLILARTLASSGQLEAAISELTRLHGDEPERLDVSVALAETLWKAGRQLEAGKVSEEILEDSPDCLRANLLLGAIQSKSRGREAEMSVRCLARARQLDPAGATALDLLGSPLPLALSTPLNDLTPVVAKTTPVAPTAKANDASSPQRTVGEASGLQTSPGRMAVAVEEEPSDPAAWLREPTRDSAEVRGATESRATGQRQSQAQVTTQPIELSERRAELPPEMAAEWGDLLDEVITLDNESEDRLRRALSDAGLSNAPEKVEGSWVEVRTDNDNARLTDIASGKASPAASPNGGMKESPASKKPAVEEAPKPTIERAKQLWKAGELDAAVKVCRELLQQTSDNAPAIITELKSLIEVHPRHGSAHRVLGDAFMRSGQFQQAIEEYNLALACK